ncbi:hypothetical protein P355_4145 [Burkholderia cenocepacia KC-01]|nr:hypothetical protein P355_4145 [Burkholderia cenocepacia KC-01]
MQDKVDEMKQRIQMRFLEGDGAGTAGTGQTWPRRPPAKAARATG